MMVSEVSAYADAALPVAQFRAHLRLGSGFGEDGLQDDLLLGFLRAAVAAIELRTGRMLITRGFSLRLEAWRDGEVEPLPLRPVTAVGAVVLVDAIGTELVVEADRYRLVPDAQAPALCAGATLLPTIPARGHVRIALTAGMAADWGGLPADLGQAVLLLAAHYYEFRHETALGAGCMPFGVTSLIDRYRQVGITLGLGSVGQ